MGERIRRDEEWVRERFGDVGPAPSNEVVVTGRQAQPQPRARWANSQHGLAHPK